MKDFKDKVAVITGGASGIGRAMAERFAQAGMKIVLADIEEPALDAAVAAMRASGVDVVGVKTDVSKSEQIDALAAKTIETFGKVHILCNNAGVGSAPRATWELTKADWEWVVGVNLWGVIYGIQSFVPIMLKQDEPGHVINTASIAGLLSLGMMSPYFATKHAVVSISESLHFEFTVRGTKLKAHALCPAFVNTRIGESERNRPDQDHADLDAIGVQVGQAFAHRLATGTPPAEIAEKVFQAVEEDRLYILTHPERKPEFEWRAANILNDRNPDVLSMLSRLG
ncbi:MAG TPA: SDR family NAD(P)-dependent oxidoreductase [Bryobacteraceae bacterium]|jgi:NAD(P)-dependent dehydrogenase (short-subunit alcohol dehydrogenase family)